MKDYGWGLFRKGLKRRSKEVRRMRIMTCLAVFFLAFTLLLQDILSAYRMEMNYRSFGSWAVRREDTTYEGNGALRPCGIISRGSMLYDLYPRATDIDPETEEPYGETRFDVEVKDSITVGGEEVPFGTHQIFEAGRARVAVEICEDLWVPAPPSSIAAINGANVIVNLSASNELIGKHTYLMDLIKHQSAHCIAAYVYASCGYGESTTDLVFGG
ncbi:MAG: hypothetical protein J6P98_00100, partial [Clostridia bacterium]|nr:hypothetical protein [Clostridia bacterium]